MDTGNNGDYLVITTTSLIWVTGAVKFLIVMSILHEKLSDKIMNADFSPI